MTPLQVDTLVFYFTPCGMGGGVFSPKSYLLFVTNSGMECMLYCSFCCIFVASNLEKGHKLMKKDKDVTEKGQIWL